MPKPSISVQVNRGIVEVVGMAADGAEVYRRRYLRVATSEQEAVIEQAAEATGMAPDEIRSAIEHAYSGEDSKPPQESVTILGAPSRIKVDGFDGEIRITPPRGSGRQFSIVIHGGGKRFVGRGTLDDLKGRQEAVSQVCQELEVSTSGKLAASLRRRFEEAAAQWVEEMSAPPKIPASSTEFDQAVGEEPIATEWDVCCRLISKHGTALRYVRPWRTWLVYDGTRWVRDADGEVERRTKVMINDVLPEVWQRVEDRKEAQRLVRKLRGARVVNDAMSLACTERVVAAGTDQWDRDPWLLNATNGTVDLRTGDLLAHEPGRYLIKQSTVAFNPEARCPTWHRFLETIMPDEELRKYVRRALGYTLTGKVSAHVLHVLHGGGSNGKSTLMETVQRIMGNYAEAIPPGLLMSKKNDRHPSEIAMLRGLRMAYASETPEGDRLDESQVKSITGGDTLSARAMYGDWFTFQPTHKLWIATNHRPRIKGADFGIWRRIRMIPFTVQFGHKAGQLPPDPDLPTRLLEELEGILAWMVEGAVEYFEDGALRPCEAVMAATDDYRSEQDNFGDFVEDCLELDQDAFTASGEMLKTYQAWAELNGIAKTYWLGRKRLVQEVKERLPNVVQDKHPVRGFRGMRLRMDWRHRAGGDGGDVEF